MENDMKPLRYIMIGAAIACSLATFAWYSSVSGTVSSQHSAATVSTPVARPVPTTLVTEASRENVRLFPGTVHATNSVELSFSVDGVLVELDGREGRIVQKGEVLARLDERDFQNGLDAARASYFTGRCRFSSSGGAAGTKCHLPGRI